MVIHNTLLGRVDTLEHRNSQGYILWWWCYTLVGRVGTLEDRIIHQKTFGGGVKHKWVEWVLWNTLWQWCSTLVCRVGTLEDRIIHQSTFGGDVIH